jgi:hypothetical protein
MATIEVTMLLDKGLLIVTVRRANRRNGVGLDGTEVPTRREATVVDLGRTEL